MLRLIITKEIRESVLSLRFFLGLLLGIVLFASSVFLLSEDYRQRLHDYQTRVRFEDEALDKAAHLNRLEGMIRFRQRPLPLSMLFHGLTAEEQTEHLRSNPFPRLNLKYDLFFIISFVMSFMAVTFSYDRVSGEIEKGTLPLVLSNALPRQRLLISKWLGTFVVISAIFLTSILLVCALVYLDPQVSFATDDWLALALISIAAMIYYSCFILVGLLFSTLARKSSTSFLLALFLWIMFIVVTPNISPYVSAMVYRIPSISEIEDRIYQISVVERERAIREAMRPYLLQGLPEKEVLERAEIWRINKEFSERVDEIRLDFDRKRATQVRIARALSCLSPLPPLAYLSIELAGTGFADKDHYEAMRLQFSERFRTYVQAEYEEALQKNPQFSINDYLDLSDRPRFSYIPLPLRDRLKVSLPHIALLLIFNAAFFSLAAFSFAHLDVRQR